MKRFLCVFATIMLLAASAMAEENYPDGIYRGFYYDGGIEQIAIQFELKNGLFESIVYRGIKYKDGDYLSADASDAQKGTLKQYQQLAQYLLGKGVKAIEDLYFPYDIVEDVDAVTTATIPSSKLISALWDGLNRRPFKLLDTSKLPAAPVYADGMYRGSYMENGQEEVALEFVLENGIFTSVTYRALAYKDQDYLAQEVPQAVVQVRGQFEQLIEWLVGKPVSAVNELYLPGEIVDDVDAATGATIRAPKVISAIWDGLNRHAYQIEDVAE